MNFPHNRHHLIVHCVIIISIIFLIRLCSSIAQSVLFRKYRKDRNFPGFHIKNKTQKAVFSHQNTRLQKESCLNMKNSKYRSDWIVGF